MNRFAFYCPDCGELEVTENAPPGDGAAACLYCGAAARWWPIDEAGEFLPGGSPTPPPPFLRTLVRETSEKLTAR